MNKARMSDAGWWSQMIAVTYEQECGLRDKHQMTDGYAVSASRTFGHLKFQLANYTTTGVTTNCVNNGSRSRLSFARPR